MTVLGAQKNRLIETKNRLIEMILLRVAGQFGLKSSRPTSRVSLGSTRPGSTRPGVDSVVTL